MCYLDVQLSYRMMFTYSCSKLKTFLMFNHFFLILYGEKVNHVFFHILPVSDHKTKK